VILQIEVHQLLHIRSNDLVWARSAFSFLASCTEQRTSIDKDDFVQIHWEQDIQEQDLVCPNYPLFLGLSSKPMRPFICHHFIFEPVFLGQVRDECLGGSTHVTSRGSRLTKNEGERKFSMNQNLTVLWVCFITLKIMMEANRYTSALEYSKTMAYLVE
jgi:hypothetical protein